MSRMNTTPTHATLAGLTLVRHPLVQHKLTMLRDRRTSRKLFAELVSELAMLVAYEAMRDLPLKETPIETPLERSTGQRISDERITLVPVLRAGLGMVEGILKLVPSLVVAHVGFYRDHDNLQPVAYYSNLPSDAAERVFLLLDPMLATGGTAVSAISLLKDAGARHIQFLCLVAAPEGVRRVRDVHPDVSTFAVALDRELDERGYILPGLGDAGDRLFGTTP